MEMIHHDILLIGGGAAGLRAALEVARADASTGVGIVSKVYPMRSHTVAAEGGAAGVVARDDDLDTHAFDTVSGGEWLCDQDAVEVFVQEAPGELARLERWGCPWSREADGTVAVRPFGGMEKERTWFAADKTGFHLLHTLYQRALRHEALVFHDEWMVTRLLVDQGSCRGAVALELATGRVATFLARAVILCTGGGGQVYPYTTNGSIKTGDGMALALRVGVPLKDMEFVQYHPTGLPFTGILVSEAARGEGGWLVNRDGYRYLQDYDLGEPRDEPVKRTMELGPRDRLSQAFVKEMERGRTVETPHGRVVHLDLRHLGEEVIDQKLPFVREICRTYEKIDPVHELIPVRPVVHYMMGGVHTDLHGATPLPGLFAAGEVACVNINGANRLGSNSLTECLVFGARAGRAAAACARDELPPVSEDTLRAAFRESHRIHHGILGRPAGEEGAASIRKALHEAMEGGAGIYREEEEMRASLETVRALRERLRTTGLEDRSLTFNTELTQYLELENLLDVGEAILLAALHRQESRGAHQRRDFPDRDDDGHLHHSMVRRTGHATPTVEALPVTLTRWPPGERSYGQKKEG
jgi:fumarate reductase flavoprotein subunit